jgi:hypothetical protein
MSITPPTDSAIRIAGYGYVALLVANVFWYGTRGSRLGRYALALLIFLPAVGCLCLGLSMVSAGANSNHTPDAVSDPSGLAAIIGLGVCGVGVVIAFFGVRVLARPIKRLNDDKKG